MKTRIMSWLVAAAVLGGLACSTSPGMEQRVGASVPVTGADKQEVASLTPIPDSAELILAAEWARTKSAGGFRANELYAMDARGENIIQITHHAQLYNHFAASPSRTMIAAIRFAGDTDGDGKITFRDRKTLWIIDLRNKEEWPLVPEYDAGWGGVDWSPDGQYVYLSILRDFQSDIYRIRPDGTGFQNVTEGIELALGAQKGAKWVSDVSVSFDGQWIAFLYSRLKGPRRFRGSSKSVIVVCRVDGTAPRIVTDGGSLPPGKHGPFGAGDFDPEFSADGRHITFQRATGKGVNWAGVPSHDIMTVKIDGTALRRLSLEGNTGVHGIADWSADNRIVFTEWNKADNYIGPVLMQGEGGNYHRVTKARGGTHVRWIPPLN